MLSPSPAQRQNGPVREGTMRCKAYPLSIMPERCPLRALGSPSIRYTICQYMSIEVSLCQHIIAHAPRKNLCYMPYVTYDVPCALYTAYGMLCQILDTIQVNTTCNIMFLHHVYTLRTKYVGIPSTYCGVHYMLYDKQYMLLAACYAL